jgi:hypothetical protein
VLAVFAALLVVGCGRGVSDEVGSASVADAVSRARDAEGRYISWREHLVDDVSLDGTQLSGSDGLVAGDLDGDGFEDIVSVHEGDTTYDGVARGHVRIAFGTGDAHRWHNVTLSEGPDAGAAEDAAIGDMNGDGWPDIVVACELAHLIYFQNPGGDAARTSPWPRLIPANARDRGSFIRVFLADFDGDGIHEVVTPNKGEQNPDRETATLDPISWFDAGGRPLDDEWEEHELARVRIPINSHVVDLDADGDPDIVAGSRGEARIFWFENTSSEGTISFDEHTIEIAGTSAPPEAARPPRLRGETRSLVTGFNMDFPDLSGDGRPDIVISEWPGHLVWLEQPSVPKASWQLRYIGTQRPDVLVGIAAADIDGDGDDDVFAGAYSSGPRDQDGEQITAADALGRLSWFENPGELDGYWTRHDVSRRKRGMFDKFLPRDLDGDGDVDFLGTRGNSMPYDGVFWLEQVRSTEPAPAFEPARETDSEQMPLADQASITNSLP